METGFGSRELKSVFLFSDGEKINWYVFLSSLSRLASCGIISPKRCDQLVFFPPFVCSFMILS